MAVTNILTPAISIPLAAMAALLLGCVKLRDTYKSVNWPAVATVGGMISLGLALEKTGAAEALAHTIVASFQWAGAISIFCALLAFTVTLTQLIENAAVAIILCADCLPDRTGEPRGPKALHGGIGNLYFNVVLHACGPRNHNAGDGAWTVSLQELPFDWQWNGCHRVAACRICDAKDLEILVTASNRTVRFLQSNDMTKGVRH
jgi:hypothetical protein